MFHQLRLLRPQQPLAGRIACNFVSRLLLFPAKDGGQSLWCSGACWGDVKDLGAGRQGAPAGSVLLQASAWSGKCLAQMLSWGQRWPVADTGGSPFCLPIRVPWWKGHFQGALLPDSVGSRCAGCGPCEAGSLPSLTLTFGVSSADLPRTSPLLAPLPSCTRPYPPISTLGLAPPVHPASLQTPSSAQEHFGQLLCQERCLALVVERIRCFLPFFPGHACLDLFFPTSCVWSCPFYNTCVGFLLFCFLIFSHTSSHFY